MISKYLKAENYIAYENEDNGNTEILKGKDGAIRVKVINNTASQPVEGNSYTPMTYEYTLVTQADCDNEPTKYVPDSLNQIKTETRYFTTGATQTITKTFEYGFVEDSTIPSKITETITNL